jgi:hypothetical protein
MPSYGDLDLSDLDEDHVTAILDLEILYFCYAEIEKELQGETELIGQEEADALYGVSKFDFNEVR